MRSAEDHKKQADYSRLQYSGSRNTVRAWFVGFGVGGPVIVLSNETITAALTKGRLVWVCILFFSAALCQIVAGILTKRKHQDVLLNALIRGHAKAVKMPIKTPLSIWSQASLGLNSMCADFITLGLLTAAGILVVASLISGSTAAATTMPAAP